MTDPTDGGNGARTENGRREPDWYLAEGDRQTRTHASERPRQQSGQANVASSNGPPLLRRARIEQREFNVLIFYKHNA